jgi:hypothetical protein
MQIVDTTLKVLHLETVKQTFRISLGERICRTSQRQHC